jgi:NTE family protein
VAEQLSKLSLSPEQYAAYRRGKGTILAQDLTPVDKVSFTKMDRVSPEYVRSLMKTKPDEKINQKELDADMRKIYGTGDFEHVGYRIMDEDGQRRLIVNAEEKNWGPNYFRFGLGFDTNFAGETDARVVSRYRRTWINSLGAEWLTDVSIGSTDSIVSEFYQPINESHKYFVAPKLELKRTTSDLYDGSHKLNSFDINRYRVGVDFGQDLFQYGQIRAGVVAGVIEQSVDVGAKLPDENYTEGAFRVGLQIDKLDSVAFPQAGYALQTLLYNSNSALGADDNYTKYDISGTYFKTFGKNTFGFALKASGALGSDKLPTYDQSSWGGLLKMSGYAPGQLLGQTLTFGRITYYNKLADYTMFDGLFVGLSLEAGKMSDPLMPRSNSDLITAGSAYVATDSPIGPLYLGYGRADDGNDSLYLYLGYPY